MRKKPLHEQVVVVTGASSGLGRAIARLAGERGVKVVVTARNAEALDNAVAEIEASGSEALAVPADQTVQDEVGRVVEQAIDRFGRIDTYCANAIVTVYAEAGRLEPERGAAGGAVPLILPGAINPPQFARARQKTGSRPQPVPPIYQPEPF